MLQHILEALTREPFLLVVIISGVGLIGALRACTRAKSWGPLAVSAVIAHAAWLVASVALARIPDLPLTIGVAQSLYGAAFAGSAAFAVAAIGALLVAASRRPGPRAPDASGEVSNRERREEAKLARLYLNRTVAKWSDGAGNLLTQGIEEVGAVRIGALFGGKVTPQRHHALAIVAMANTVELLDAAGLNVQDWLNRSHQSLSGMAPVDWLTNAREPDEFAAFETAARTTIDEDAVRRQPAPPADAPVAPS
jgi:hypothetical protein